MMTTRNRIDWSDPRISPAVYEDIVSVLLSSLHPDAQRIDGSGGDGGRDVQLPLPAGLEVFEMKSFTGRMTPARRRQVERSLKNAARLSPARWHLVVPINHTAAERAWFEKATGEYSFPCDWLGQDWLDSHMADHPELPRYYIEGSNDEIVAALLELNREQAALAGGLPDAADRVTALASRLNELDPHYMFAFSASPAEGTRVTILPRYAGAEQGSQIRVQASFNFPDTAAGQSAAAALRETFGYGAPGKVSREFVSTITAEGITGLNRVLADSAEIAFGPAEVAPGPGMPEMALRLVDGHGIAVTQLPLKFISLSRGLLGGDLVLTDYSEVMRVTIRLHVQERRFTLSYSFSAPETVLPCALLPALRFLCGVQSGLQMVLLADGEPQGPPASDPQTVPDEINVYMRLAADLSEIQRSSGIYFPMPRSLSRQEEEDILLARQLLSGETVTAEWTSSAITIPARSLEGFKELSYREMPLWVRVPFTLSLEDRNYPLGYLLRNQAAATLRDWPVLPPDADPDTEVEVTFSPGADASLTMKLLTVEELREAAGSRPEQ